MNSEHRSEQSKVRQLRRQALCAAEESRQAIDRALLAAWEVGRLLDKEQARVRRTMGKGAWQHWLTANFPGAQRTAMRYLKLARSVDDPNTLQQLSLRQAYFRLDISTEPKVRGRSYRLPLLPAHIRHAQRVLLSVRTRLRLRQMSVGDRERLRDDLRPLHQQLNALFAAEAHVPSRVDSPIRHRPCKDSNPR